MLRVCKYIHSDVVMSLMQRVKLVFALDKAQIKDLSILLWFMKKIVEIEETWFYRFLDTNVNKIERLYSMSCVYVSHRDYPTHELMDQQNLLYKERNKISPNDKKGLKENMAKQSKLDDVWRSLYIMLQGKICRLTTSWIPKREGLILYRLIGIIRDAIHHHDACYDVINKRRKVKKKSK